MKYQVVKLLLLLVIVSCIMIPTGFCSKSDSLKNVIANSEDDYTKAKNLNELSIAYHEENNFDEAIKAASEALNIAKWNNFTDLIIESYNNLAFTYFYYPNYALSLENHLKQANYLEKTSDRLSLVKTYNNIATIYNLLEEPKRALHYGNLSFSELKSNPDQELLVDYYTNLVRSYNLLKEHDKEIKYLNKIISLREEHNKITSLGIEYNKLGSSYWRINQYDSALKYYNKYLTTSIIINDSLGIARALHNIGSTYNSKKEYIKSVKYLKRAEQLNQSNISITYTELVYSYCKLNDLQKAKHYFHLAEKAKADLKELAKASDSIVALCVAKNNIKEALKYQMTTSRLKDELLAASHRDVASTVKAKYEVEGIEARLAEKENYLLAKENLELQAKQKQFLIIILILTVTIAAGSVYLIRRRLVEKEKKLVFFEEGIEELGRCIQDIKELKAPKKASL